MASIPPTRTGAWQALAAHYSEIKGVSLRRLFADDAARAERFSAETMGCSWTTQRTSSSRRRCSCCCGLPRNAV